MTSGALVICGFLYHITTHFCLVRLFERSRNESREEGRQKRFLADKCKALGRNGLGISNKLLYDSQGKAELFNELKVKQGAFPPGSTPAPFPSPSSLSGTRLPNSEGDLQPQEQLG